MTHRAWRKKFTPKVLAFILATALFAALNLQSCGQKFIPFEDAPIANTDNQYFMSMCENPDRYKNMFTYLVMEYYEESKNAGYSVDFDYDSDAFRECERQFKEWKELYPAYAERMENTLGELITMSSHIKHKNMEKKFNAMLKTVTDFLAAQFTQDAELVSNYASLVSDEFLNLCAADTIQKYCSENNLTVTSVEYDSYPSAVTHHYYPFSFDYSATVLYTANLKDPEGKKIKTYSLKLRYFIGIDNNENYIIEYVADVSGIEVIPAPTLPEDSTEEN